jgi:hypothetical protein
VRVVQVPRDEVIGVRRMRHRFVPAPGFMLVAYCVCAAGVRVGALVGIICRYLDDVFVDMVLVHGMKMPVVKIVDVPGVSNLGMGAVIAVRVAVAAVSRMFHGLSIPPPQATKVPALEELDLDL